MPKSGMWGIIMGWMMINGYLEKCLLIFSVGLYAVLDVAFQKETPIQIWISKQISGLSREISLQRNLSARY